MSRRKALDEIESEIDSEMESYTSIAVEDEEEIEIEDEYIELDGEEDENEVELEPESSPEIEDEEEDRLRDSVFAEPERKVVTLQGAIKEEKTTKLAKPDSNVEAAKSLAAKIVERDYTLKLNFLELGSDLNALEAMQGAQLLGFADTNDFVSQNLGAHRIPVARKAMRITETLHLPFDTLCKLSDDVLNMMSRLPEDVRDDPKWEEMAESLSEDDFREQISKEVPKAAAAQFIESLEKRQFKAPKSVCSLWDDAVEMARTLNISEGLGSTTEVAIERLARDFSNAPNDKTPSLSNLDVWRNQAKDNKFAEHVQDAKANKERREQAKANLDTNPETAPSASRKIAKAPTPIQAKKTAPKAAQRQEKAFRSFPKSKTKGKVVPRKSKGKKK